MRGRCDWDEEACSSAAAGNQLFVLQWLRYHGCPWDWKTWSRAAEEGHENVAHWAKVNGCPR